MAEDKQKQVREAISVWEESTGKKYKTGISADAVKSREAYKTWARSPAGKQAWKNRKAGEAKKPEAAEATKKPEASKAPESKPEPKAPKTDGQPAQAGAAALGGRSATTTSRAKVGTKAHGEARRQEKVEKGIVKATAREKYQGSAAAKPEGGIGDVASREKKKKDED